MTDSINEQCTMFYYEEDGAAYSQIVQEIHLKYTSN